MQTGADLLGGASCEVEGLLEVVEGVDEDDVYEVGLSPLFRDLCDHVERRAAGQAERGGLVQPGQVVDGPGEDLLRGVGRQLGVEGGEGSGGERESGRRGVGGRRGGRVRVFARQDLGGSDKRGRHGGWYAMGGGWWMEGGGRWEGEGVSPASKGRFFPVLPKVEVGGGEGRRGVALL